VNARRTVPHWQISLCVRSPDSIRSKHDLQVHKTMYGNRMRDFEIGMVPVTCGSVRGWTCSLGLYGRTPVTEGTCQNVTSLKKVSFYIAQLPDWDCSKHFTSYFLADLFNRKRSRFLWEASSHAATNTRRLFVHTYPPLSIDRYSPIQLCELGELE